MGAECWISSISMSLALLGGGDGWAGLYLNGGDWRGARGEGWREGEGEGWEQGWEQSRANGHERE